MGCSDTIDPYEQFRAKEIESRLVTVAKATTWKKHTSPSVATQSTTEGKGKNKDKTKKKFGHNDKAKDEESEG